MKTWRDKQTGIANNKSARELKRYLHASTGFSEHLTEYTQKLDGWIA